MNAEPLISAGRVIAATIAGTGVSDERLTAISGRILEALDEEGLFVGRRGPLDDVHQIEFRDDGWTVLHTLDERVDGSLFDCRMTWTTSDPGVRGRFVLDDLNTIGDRVTGESENTG